MAIEEARPEIPEERYHDDTTPEYVARYGNEGFRMWDDRLIYMCL